MNKQDQKIALAVLGVGLMAVGHRLMNVEFGKLGVPHVVGSVAVALALRA